MKIIVMMPAYNEERDLPGLLERLREALHSWADFSIIVVDDGSQDSTAKIVLKAAETMPIELIQHDFNQGLGAAMRTGLAAAAARGDVVVTLDADNSQGPELIRTMVERLKEGYDVVIASRFQPGAREVGVPPFRKLLSHVASSGLRFLVPYPGARDYTCGFRAYDAKILRRLIETYGDRFLRETGFSCMLELLINLRRLRARVSEVPLVLRYDLKEGASKMRILRTVWRYVVTISRGLLPLSRREASAVQTPHAPG